MKTQFKSLFSVAAFLSMGLAACAQSGTSQTGQEATSASTEEVPGDNFSLEGALELFKKSASPQEFEQLLNSPDSKVNNLDLNGDGQIDYIRVADKTENNIHDFILSDVVSASESQDVAVIELEKRSDGSAVLQIVGDADIYGVETIIEPTSEVKVNAGTTTARSTVNVSAWPSVQYVYGMGYNPWISPWGWSYYPGWYSPWRPIVWNTWYPYWAPYRPYYSLAYRHRIGFASSIYRPYRSTSVFVYNRNYAQINHFRSMPRNYQYGHTGVPHNNRYDNEHRWSSGGNNHTYNNGRSTNSYNNSGRTRTDYGRTRNDFNHSRSYVPSQGGNINNTTPAFRGRTSVNPTATTHVTRPYNPGSFGRASSFQRSQPSSGQFRSAPSPQQHFRSAPSPSRGGGGGGGGSHSHGGRH